MAGTLLRTKTWKGSMAEGTEMGREQEPSRKSDPGPTAKFDDELCSELPAGGRGVPCPPETVRVTVWERVCADVIELEILR